MTIFYILLAFFVIVAVIFLTIKYFFRTQPYPQEAIDILTKTFENQEFSSNGDIFQLQEKLHIKNSSKSNYEKSLKLIMEVVNHKQDLIYKNNLRHNKPYDEENSFQILTNEIIDYSLKKNINLKGSIRLLFLSLNNDTLETLLDDPKKEKEFIYLFYQLVPNFIKKFNKKLANS